MNEDSNENSIHVRSLNCPKYLRVRSSSHLDPQLLTGHKGNIKSAVLDCKRQKIFSGGDDKIIR